MTRAVFGTAKKVTIVSRSGSNANIFSIRECDYLAIEYLSLFGILASEKY